MVNFYPGCAVGSRPENRAWVHGRRAPCWPVCILGRTARACARYFSAVFFTPKMRSEISQDLFTAFFLSILKKIIKDSPETAKERCFEFGESTGERISDDFFARFALYRRADNTQACKYISLFFKHYFGISATAVNNEVRLNEVFNRFSGEYGYWFFCGVLTALFGHLCTGVSFEVVEDRIVYKITSV